MTRSVVNVPTEVRSARARRPRLAALGLGSALCLLATATTWAAEHTEEISRQFEPRSGQVVVIENLAGQIDVQGVAGGPVTLEAKLIGQGDSATEAARLAGKLSLDVEDEGGQLVVHVHYPVEEFSNFHYPGGGQSGWLGGNSRSRTRYQGRQVTVMSKKKGNAATLFADLELQIPYGTEVEIRNVAGSINAEGVQSALTLDTGSGDLRATAGAGDLSLDSGSGDVEVSNYRGTVEADTGSGDVLLTSIQGDVEADTGSGDVELEDVEGATISIDTGSGDVVLRRVRGEILSDTGSGDIAGQDLIVTGELNIDTGSGDVSLSGDLSQMERMQIDTGSGEVSVDGRLPPMDLVIDTGGGRIDVDVPGAEVLRRDEEEYEGRIHGGGFRGEIDTGSGGVEVRGGA